MTYEQFEINMRFAYKNFVFKIYVLNIDDFIKQPKN